MGYKRIPVMLLRKAQEEDRDEGAEQKAGPHQPALAADLKGQENTDRDRRQKKKGHGQAEKLKRHRWLFGPALHLR